MLDLEFLVFSTCSLHLICYNHLGSSDCKILLVSTKHKPLAKKTSKHCFCPVVQTGGHGGICPPSDSLPPPPHTFPSQKKKICHFLHFFTFLSPQKRILPPRYPQKNILVLPLHLPLSNTASKGS